MSNEASNTCTRIVWIEFYGDEYARLTEGNNNTSSSSRTTTALCVCVNSFVHTDTHTHIHTRTFMGKQTHISTYTHTSDSNTAPYGSDRTSNRDDRRGASVPRMNERNATNKSTNWKKNLTYREPRTQSRVSFVLIEEKLDSTQRVCTVCILYMYIPTYSIYVYHKIVICQKEDFVFPCVLAVILRLFRSAANVFLCSAFFTTRRVCVCSIPCPRWAQVSVARNIYFQHTHTHRKKKTHAHTASNQIGRSFA